MRSSSTNRVSLRISEPDFAKLEHQASALGVAAAVLRRTLVSRIR